MGSEGVKFYSAVFLYFSRSRSKFSCCPISQEGDNTVLVVYLVGNQILVVLSWELLHPQGVRDPSEPAHATAAVSCHSTPAAVRSSRSLARDSAVNGPAGRRTVAWGIRSNIAIASFTTTKNGASSWYNAASSRRPRSNSAAAVGCPCWNRS